MKKNHSKIMGGKKIYENFPFSFRIVDAYRKIMYTIFIIANSSGALSSDVAERFKLNMLISPVFIIKHFSFISGRSSWWKEESFVVLYEKTSLETLDKYHYE